MTQLIREREKCDQTKPACLKCTRSGRKCLTASIIEQPGFSINDENSYASGKLKRPRGPRSNLTLLRPQFDLEARALDYFLLHHVVQLDDLLGGMPDVAQGLCGTTAIWKASGRNSVMVDKALTCVSMAVFARTRQAPIVAVDASVKYGRLLRMMQQKVQNFPLLALTSPGNENEEVSIDAYLLTMLLMGRYESTMHDYSGIPNLYQVAPSLHRWIHHEGALTILRRWSEAASNGRASAPTNIMKLSRRGMLQSSLRQNIPLQDWIIDGSRFGECGLGLEYDGILVATVDLYQRVGSMIRSHSLIESTRLELIEEAHVIDTRLQEWASRFPDAGALQWHTLAPNPGPWSHADYHPSTIDHFDEPRYATVWIQYFATRMLVKSTCLSVFDVGVQVCGPSFDSSFVEQHRSECSQQLHRLADRMVSAVVAFSHLGKTGRKETMRRPVGSHDQESTMVEGKPSVAGLIIWPLAVAASINGLEPRQQQWFRAEIARIGKSIGNGFFELAATCPEWTILGRSEDHSPVAGH
ncbi:uncharacterized protein A1O9_09287 [Exophiala aquamarina CBS 119918]|uniref:Zn(2)-C6 fungal-type domain-containing protein n=1 Tax=Exophiala aquamarina CBS 119918 TaxID=1182545 RepID=A0A072PH55_9EURO|nr:uncharacterized protein A1O9_09287 [Exophiala aquamarina CBS 119918]KEF54845.1 hypothetical protein A1O9_09287 [Exophiala aquamarina CBS 119918]